MSVEVGARLSSADFRIGPDLHSAYREAPAPRVKYDSEQIINNTRILMLDPAELNSPLALLARSVVAEGYAWRIFRKNEIGDIGRDQLAAARNKAFIELGYDKYDATGRARSFVAITSLQDEHGQLQDYVAGHVRLVRGVENGIEPLDLLNFVELNRKWPHELNESPVDMLAELGRFSLARWTTKSGEQAKDFVTRELYDHAAREALRLGVANLYAIMPSEVTTILGRAGIKYESLEGKQFLFKKPNARETHPMAVAIAESYPGYWIDGEPDLFHFTSYAELRDSQNVLGQGSVRRIS